MRGIRLGVGFLWLLIMSKTVLGADVPSSDRRALDADRQSADVRALVETIDRLVAAKWAEARTQPAAPADDAEYLRRVYLDVNGKIPTASQAREFLDDTSPDKRAKLVERLLASPAYSGHMTNLWRALLLPEATGNVQVQILAMNFDGWLRKGFAENAGYDRMVREVLTAPLERNQRNPNRLGESAPSPYAFIAAKDGKPENLAASSARLFLGIRLECAQCHDHPFAHWKRDQFWGLAAFFGGVERVGDGEAFFEARELGDRRELAIPGSDRAVQAAFLDGTQTEWRPKVGARTVLADWMTSPDNPYFARATANRIWAQFFGSGIVDPVDDLSANVQPSHPELLDELAHQFVAHKFDLKFLIRAITASRAYQLSSSGYSPGQDDAHLFARAAVRGLTPQQLYDSLILASGIRREPDVPAFFQNDSPRKDFLDRFSSPEEKPSDHQTSILQALTLMNGRLMIDATSLERGGTLPAVADAYFLDTPGKIEALYLATLSRRPRPEELDRLVPYVDRGGPTLNPKQSLADVVWALLNSAEFVSNH
jgi:Protein of unknown function (DUF1553)/Protein of unknown function (DUF1549)